MRSHHADSELYDVLCQAASFNERGVPSAEYLSPSIDIDHPSMDSQDTPGKWIQVYSGDLVPVILQLFESPTLRPIEAGKDGESSRPLTAAVRFSIASIQPAIIPYPILQTLGSADFTSPELEYLAMGPTVL
ncbi:hypothetical protein EST38_g10932 [Candolleomyces aberdarensis]|uniref:Uncharacterized protein n=1 Tax=Candolleomyces aberdarensis TaxID=2316362 RepID=A0A4Q2D663_9AGAR|nr:hypothetical protein EST38_g10932 [Candolleomyces aberdarensis]